ncbi:MAG: DNA-binding response regulator [bacterium]|nr:MAG: DNA-binding response regulator [bacterium]
MNNRILAIIIEDEEPARNLLKVYLQSHDEIELVAECENGFDGVKAIAEYRPDLIFLDIQMPKLTGFEMLELLDEYPEIIFTTAYDEFALRAFELNAVDYLMKPFSKARFDGALEKVFTRLKNKSQQNTSVEKLKEQVQETSGPQERFFVKTGSRIDVIPVEDIIHVEAQDDYVELHTTKGRFLKKETMNRLELQLPPEKFIRVHRSHIIRVDQMEKLEKYGKESYMVILKNGAKVLVSKSRIKSLKEQLGI